MSKITANEDGLKLRKREVEQVNSQSTKEIGSCPEVVRDAILFQLNERVAWGEITDAER